MKNKIINQNLDHKLIEINELTDKKNQVDKLSKEIEDVNNLFNDFSLLISFQGEKIDNIENQINKTVIAGNNANNQLNKASNFQKKRKYCFCLFYIFGGLIIISILFIFITNH